MTSGHVFGRLFTGHELLEDITVAVRNGIVAGIGRAEDILPRCDAVRHHDGIGLPGFTNAHTHLELTGFAPVGADDLWSWIEQLVAAKRRETPDGWMGRIAAGESALLDTGTTAVGDIRSVLPDAPAFTDGRLDGRCFFEVLGHGDLFEAKWRQFETFLSRNPRTAALSVHAPHTTDLGCARRAIGSARDLGLPVMMHLAERAEEGELLFTGASPGSERIFPDRQAHRFDSYADVIGQLDLGPDTAIVHGVQLDQADWAAVEEHRIPVVLCPRSNERFAGRLPDVRHVVGSTIAFAIGTDSTVTSPDLDVLADARLLYALSGGGARAASRIACALTAGGREMLRLPRCGFAQGSPFICNLFTSARSLEDVLDSAGRPVTLTGKEA